MQLHPTSDDLALAKFVSKLDAVTFVVALDDDGIPEPRATEALQAIFRIGEMPGAQEGIAE